MRRLTLRDILAVYARVGLTTFGGGDPTVIALRQELLEQRYALNEDEFGSSYTLARITPGTNMLAFCAGSGWQMAGRWGAVVAVVAISVPAAVLSVILTIGLEVTGRNPVAAAAISAMLAAAVGLMLAGAWWMIRPQWRLANAPRVFIFVAGAFALAWWANWAPLAVLAVAAVAGWLWPERAAE